MTAPSDIRHKLQTIEDRIVEACERSGRTRDAVRLLAASKGVSVERIADAIHCGHMLFGESRPQAIRDKADAFRNSDEPPEWHLIGPLQRNKVKYVVGRVTMIHSLHTLNVAQAISNRVQQQSAAPIDVLVQINIGMEPNKSGVDPKHALELCHQITQLPGVQLQGFMALPPLFSDPGQAGPYFDKVANLAEIGRKEGLPLRELSYGMSGDFVQAIQHGATIIRIGTAIFGPRAP